jgi:branched-chain amino acid transport system permease protein
MNLFWHFLMLFAINSLLVAGMGLIIGVGGVVALNAGAFAAVGAYTYGIATANFHWPVVPAFLLAMAGGLVISSIIGRAITLLRGEELVLGTLAAQLVTSSVVANLDGVTGGLYGLPGITRIGFWFHSFAGTVIVTLTVCAFGLLVLWLLYRSPFARALRGTRDAPLDTILLGRSIPTIQRRAFACAAMASAAAGALLASYLTYVDPTVVDLGLSVTVLAAVIVGGAGTFSGALAGAAIMTLVPETLRFMPVMNGSSPALQQILFGAVLLVCVLRRPRGILGEFGFRGAL